MTTEVLTVQPQAPALEALRRAAAILQRGGLVAFPTETVYGLGANALDADACARIFAAKGRPAHNPIIVHVADAASVLPLVAAWPEQAERLAQRFWPGPLTLVLPRSDRVPSIVTAGGPTVAVRVPAHPVALALLRESSLPIAAPSANRSMQLSPTTAEHVVQSLNGRIDLILDGGPATGGLESTVLDLSRQPPVLLRPGLVTVAELESIIGAVVLPMHASAPTAAPLPSPGMLPRHYAPRTPLIAIEGNATDEATRRRAAGQRVACVRFGPSSADALPVERQVDLPGEPAGSAARLYAVLHELDALGLDAILVELPPATQEWLAVRDRLRRAAAR
ncbi:MAG: threonylcarbamoyl-AMP synthase [Planctomycetia bacterium]|nr:threonylcarbamoyl-AMP synthase [Planctomycetia bacterium]